MISNTYNFIVKTYHLSSLSKFADRSELISYLYRIQVGGIKDQTTWFISLSYINLSFSNQIVYSIMINTILGNFQGSVRCIWQYSSSYIHIYTISLQTASSYIKETWSYHFEIHLAYAKIYSVLETYILRLKDSSRIIDLWGVPLIYAWIRTISLTWYARNPKYPQDEVTLYTLSCCTLVYQASPGTDQTIQQMCQ